MMSDDVDKVIKASIGCLRTKKPRRNGKLYRDMEAMFLAGMEWQAARMRDSFEQRVRSAVAWKLAQKPQPMDER